MRHYVDTLREQLGELRAGQEATGLDPAALEAYERHVKAVAAAAPRVQLPPYCTNLVSGVAAAAAAAGSNGRGGGGSSSSFFAPPVARPLVAPPPPGGRAGGTGAAAAAQGAASQAAGTGLSAAAAERLREAEAAQALLTDELAELSAQLKANALGMQGAVADRGRIIDSTDAALGDSLAAAKRNAAAAKEQVKRSGGTFCLTCAILLVVGLAFTAMVVYIKFTHLLGYRATPAVQSYLTGGWGGLWGGGGASLGAGGSAGGVDAGAGDPWVGGGYDGAAGEAYGGGAPGPGHGGEL